MSVLERIRAGERLARVPLSDRLQARGVFTYLAEDKEPFGFVTVGPSETLDPADVGEVLAWCLLARRREDGYGRKLLVHGISVLKRRQYSHAVIWLTKEEKRASAIVERLGFERGELHQTDNRGGNTITMTGWLRSLEDFF